MPQEITTIGLEALAQRFERFARRECQVSPLYERLSFGIAQDPELLALAAYTQPGQPVPNLFLAAVHFLLLQGSQHPLAAYYPSLCPATSLAADAYPSFRSFCLKHREKILELISTRLVQTNEVRRCACLLPAFALVSALGHGRPLALVEVGASAGLNLLWDHFGYEYGTGRQYGDPRSPVQIGCTLRGHRRPPLPGALPPVATRLGIDLRPIDVCDPDAALWLRALVWPDEGGRAALLQQALRVAQQHPPRLLAGNVLEQLPAALATVPADETLCVFHTHTMNQLSAEARASLAALLKEGAVARDLYRISIEWLGQEHPQLECVAFESGVQTESLLAHCGSHGEWLEWLGADGWGMA